MGAETGLEDYPRTQLEFEDRFRTEADGRAYLVTLRWPQGGGCEGCKGHVVGRTTRDRCTCAACHAQRSLTAGTVFHTTHKPRRRWFRAMGVPRVLELGSYRTAWTWLHKLRRAMVRPERDRLSGKVEVDETLGGGMEAGGGRRHVDPKALVAIAVEIRGRASGVVVTDGLPTYLSLPKWGDRHTRKVILGSGDPAHVARPRGHHVASRRAAGSGGRIRERFAHNIWIIPLMSVCSASTDGPPVRVGSCSTDCCNRRR